MIISTKSREQDALNMVPTENEAAIEFLRDKAEHDGRIQPLHHARTRPMPVQHEATHFATTMADVADRHSERKAYRSH